LNYCIRYINLPCRLSGVTVMDGEGFFNIYINSRLDYYHQQAAIQHEITHIIRGDFFREEKLEQIESM